MLSNNLGRILITCGCIIWMQRSRYWKMKKGHFKPKRNNIVGKRAPLCRKCCPFLVLFSDLVNPSVKEYTSFLTRWRSTSSLNNIGNESCKKVTFNALKSIQTWIPFIVIFFWITQGLIHFDSNWENQANNYHFINFFLKFLFYSRVQVLGLVI